MDTHAAAQQHGACLEFKIKLTLNVRAMAAAALIGWRWPLR